MYTECRNLKITGICKCPFVDNVVITAGSEKDLKENLNV